MNTTVNAPKHLISLQTCATLIHVSITVYSATINNKAEGKRITEDNKANKNAAKVTENILVGDPHYEAVIKKRTEIYSWIKEPTYPWAGSLKLLPAFRREQVLGEWATLKAEWDELVAKFISEYPNTIQRMATEAAGRGKLFNLDDYPPPAVVAAMFNMDLYEQEIPTGDFRVQVSQEAAADMTKHFQRETDRVIAEMSNMMVEKLSDLVQSIVNGCTNTTYVDKKGVTKTGHGRLVEGTLNKLVDYIELIDKFNPTGNVQLMEVKDSLNQALQGVTIDKLRTSEMHRENTKLQMTETLNKVRKIQF
jgi:hypothetical protein